MTAPTFALVLGILYTALGLLGMLSSLVMPAPGSPPGFGYLLGLFPVNATVNAIHLLAGAWGLAAWAGILGTVNYARAMSAIMAVLGILGMMPGSLGAVPLHGHNIWLHLLTAMAAAYIGFRSIGRYEALRRKAKDRRHNSPSRRATAKAVALERRKRHYDRRYHGRLATG